MKTVSRALITLPVLLLALSAAGAAQQAPARLPTGTWTGKVTPPNSETTDVTLDVAAKDDVLSITINAGEHGIFKAESIKVEAERFTFSFVPGPVVVCVLNKQEDASYAGDCTEQSGAAAHMVVSPPKPAKS